MELGIELKLSCRFVSTVVYCFLSLQSELVDLAESIQQKLSYFNELENINTVGCALLLSTSRGKIIRCMHYVCLYDYSLDISLIIKICMCVPD